MADKVEKTDVEWRDYLSPERYSVLRGKGTEPPFSGNYWDCKRPGTYLCGACGQELFEAETKFESRSGWPSFFQPVNGESVATETDSEMGMERTEVLCARCDSHLGHVFEDGPQPTGLRYCMNSLALLLRPPAEK